MEATITQSGALYLAQHKNSQHRDNFLERIAATDANRLLELRRLHVLVHCPLHDKTAAQ